MAKKGKDCVVASQVCDDAEKTQVTVYEANVEHQISRILTHPTRSISPYTQAKDKKLVNKAQKAHTQVYNRLKDHLMKNGELSFFRVPPSWHVTGLLNFLSGTFKGGETSQTLMSNPHRVLGVAKRLNELIDAAESHQAKSEPTWYDRFNRAWMPIAFTGYRKERFGLINRFMDSATQFVEATRTLGASTLTSFTEATQEFDKFFSDLIMGYDITPDMIMDGVFVKTKNVAIPNAIFKGTVVRKDKNGRNIKNHIVEVNGKKYYTPEEDIDRVALTDALKRQYRDSLSNEIMSGDVRHITFTDEPTSADMAQIRKVLKQAAIKKKIGQGMDEGRMFTYEMNDIEYTVIMTQEPARGEIEQGMWKAHIVKHKDSQGKVVNYLDSKKKIVNKKIVKSKGIKKATEVFQGMDGWHRASEWRGDSPILNRRGNPIANSTDRQPVFHEDSRMENQPHPAIIKGLHGFMSDIKNSLSNFADDVIVPNKNKNQQRIKRAADMLNNNPKIAALLGYDSDEEGTPLEQVLNHFDMRNMLYVKKDGTIHTRNSFFNKKQENYYPWMWDDHVVLDMIETSIGEIEGRIGQLGAATQTQEEQEQINKQKEEAQEEIDSLKNIAELITNPGARFDSKSKLAVGVAAAMTKHRKLWTDPMLRKKDQEVLPNYVNNVIFGLQSESLYADALETLVNLAMTSNNKTKKMFNSEIEVVHNRLKLALNDPTADAFMPLFGGKDLHYNNKMVANILNRIGKVMGWNKEYDEASAQKFILTQRALTSAGLLGPLGAMVNRTQSINTFITTGYRTFRLASATIKNNYKIPEGKGGELEGIDFSKIIDLTGTDQLVSAFADAVAPVSEVESTDKAYNMFTTQLPGGQFIPAPALKRFIAMKWYEEDGSNIFIEKGGIPEIDEFLNSIEKRRVKRYKLWKLALRKGDLPSKDAKHIQNILDTIDAEAQGEKGYLRTRKIEELREVFFDLITTPKEDNKRDVLERKYRLLMGQISEERLQKMVAYKLSFWWDDIFGDSKMFTFTEGERHMRQHAVISHLIHHYFAGTLGGTSKKENFGDGVNPIQKLFESEDAIRIARQGVRNEYFGMTKVHMGEAFGGGGDSIWQYKGYPLQQMLHDWRIFQAFMNGEGTASGTMRLINEMGKIMHEGASGKGYNPKDPDVDDDARAVIRLMFSRGAMSSVGVLFEVLPYARRLLLGSNHRLMTNILSGAENPVFKITLRAISNGMLMMMFDDDEKAENGITDTGFDILRLFLPLWMTFWPMTAMNAYRSFTR